jgi:hypothetical protein
VKRGALVEGERHVRAERRLDLHRGLGAHEALGAVEVGAKAHALLGDLEYLRLPFAAGAAALDLLGDRPVAHREDLEAARVGDDRPAPGHELVQAAELGDVLVAGLDEQVEGVAEHHVVAELGDLRGLERAHGRVRGERHEGRGADLAVDGAQNAGPSRAVALLDGEGGALGEGGGRHGSRLVVPSGRGARAVREARVSLSVATARGRWRTSSPSL